MTLAEVIHEQARGRDYLELLTLSGITVAGFYLDEGEEVGAGQVLEEDQVDFKAFLPEAGGVQIRHLGGMLVEGLIEGFYTDAAGISFSAQYVLPPEQVTKLVDWLERKTGRTTSLAAVTAGPRLRLSTLAV